MHAYEFHSWVFTKVTVCKMICIATSTAVLVPNALNGSRLSGHEQVSCVKSVQSNTSQGMSESEATIPP